MGHVLVVGGTGMLWQVSLHFAEKGAITSVVGRSKRKLGQLVRESGNLEGEIQPLSLDYHDTDQFIDALEEAIQQHGPVALVVSWIHTTAREASQAIAKTINNARQPCRYFELLGSSSRDPQKSTHQRKRIFQLFHHLHYRSVILGFVCDNETSRWLTHPEIAQGVIQAVEQDRKQTVIGTTRPWSARPG